MRAGHILHRGIFELTIVFLTLSRPASALPGTFYLPPKVVAVPRPDQPADCIVTCATTGGVAGLWQSDCWTPIRFFRKVWWTASPTSFVLPAYFTRIRHSTIRCVSFDKHVIADTAAYISLHFKLILRQRGGLSYRIEVYSPTILDFDGSRLG